MAKSAPTNKKSAPAKKSTKMVYSFGKSKCEGNAKHKELLGGKGANLAEMTSIGLPVPPGFTITTATCAQYYENGKKLPAKLMDQVAAAVKIVEKETGKTFGSAEDPLLMSVRSGAAVSMPGMMDTVLNLGLNDKAVVGLANASGNKRFAYDAYRRLLNMYGDVVMGVEHEYFEDEFDKIKSKLGVK
ncbi:MAG: PEP/pyruvate-binding domain-containing protein, partial [Planctomycetota bacterium]